ncbi:MAG: PAS domain-containing protein [Ferrovibrio sp.]
MQQYAAPADAGDRLDREVTMGPPGVWPALHEPRFRSLLRHWAERRQGIMTPRSAIDPVAIRNCLSNVWIYQYLPDVDDFLCTLSGEAVNQAWGHSLMGRRITQIMSPVMLSHVQVLYRQMLALPAIQVSHRRITPADGVAQSAERLIVPLSRDDGSAYGILGITVYHLGLQASFGNLRDMQGEVTMYDCHTLPNTSP